MASRQLEDAIVAGDLALVQQLLPEDRAVNQGYGRSTPLQLASRLGHTEIVKALLAATADPNYRAISGNTPLEEACENARPDTVAVLLGAGARITDTCLFATVVGSTASTHDENSEERVEVARLLLESRNLGISPAAYVNKRNQLGRTALMLAAIKGREAMVLLLIRHGADVNAKRWDEKDPILTHSRNESALTYAKDKEHANVVKILKAAGAD